MLDYRGAATLFVDRADSGEYFDSLSAERSKSTILSLLQEPERKPLFLLGEPGVGKSHMLETIASELHQERPVVHLKEPFFDPKDFLTMLLEKMGESTDAAMEEMKTKAVEIYGAKEHLIMIDEAQLLNENSLEFLRILSDTKAFRLLLSMHKREGEEILSRPHFRSRSHRVVQMGALTADEVKRYIVGRLKESGFEEIADSISPKDLKMIHRYTDGNFRTVKRMVQSAMELLQHAKENGIKSYSRPCRCIFDMAAIELELIDA